MLFRFQERFHLTYYEAINEPWENIQRAFVIWSLEHERDKLDARRREHNQRRTQ